MEVLSEQTYISREDNHIPQLKRLRSSVSIFNQKENCILSGKFAKLYSWHPDGHT